MSAPHAAHSSRTCIRSPNSARRSVNRSASRSPTGRTGSRPAATSGRAVRCSSSARPVAGSPSPASQAASSSAAPVIAISAPDSSTFRQFTPG